MDPNLATSQRQIIHNIILSNELTAAQMADAAGCSVRAVKYIRSNLRAFRSVKAP
jgi:DNA-binding CsgD family transcriptional regulator